MPLPSPEGTGDRLKRLLAGVVAAAMTASLLPAPPANAGSSDDPCVRTNCAAQTPVPPPPLLAFHAANVLQAIGSLRASPVQPVSFGLYQEAWGMIASGRLDEASGLLNAARPRIPEDYQWLADDGMAWIRYYRGDLEGAEAAFREILGRNPGAYLSRKGLGFIELDRRNYAAAVEQLRLSFIQNPHQILLSYTIPGRRLVEASEYALARDILLLGEWVFPDSSDVAFLLARAYAGVSDVGAAADHAVAAATLAPAYIHPVFDDLGLDPARVIDAYSAMGWGLLIQEDREAALARFDQYFANGGDDPDARRGRGFANFGLGNYEAAILDLRIAAEREPGTLQPLTSEFMLPDSDQPWELTYNATSTLGWALLRAGDAEGAREAFNQALETYPDWIDALSGLGYANIALDRREEASGAFLRALLIEPRYPDARRGFAELEFTE